LAAAQAAHQSGTNLQHVRTADAPERWTGGIEFGCPGAPGRDITIYGDGSQTRAFCYVDDLIDGLMRLMGTRDEVTGPVNIGNPNEFSILELASTVIELTGSRSRIVHRPLPQDDPRQRRPDISQANQLLLWTPRISLKDGLIKTIAYFDELLKDDGVRAMLTGSSLEPA
jgi:UDP-glucuronate decarboxylase